MSGYNLNQISQTVYENSGQWKVLNGTEPTHLSYSDFKLISNDMGYSSIGKSSLYTSNAANVVTNSQIGSGAVIDNSVFAQKLLEKADSTAGTEGGTIIQGNFAPVYTSFEKSGENITGATPVAAAGSMAGNVAAGLNAAATGILMGIDLYKDDPEFWIEASAWIGDHTPWTFDDIPVAYKQLLESGSTVTKTYLPADFMQAMSDFLYSKQAYDISNKRVSGDNWALGTGTYTYRPQDALNDTSDVIMPNVYYIPRYYYTTYNHFYYLNQTYISDKPFIFSSGNIQGTGVPTNVIYNSDTTPTFPTGYKQSYANNSYAFTYNKHTYYSYSIAPSGSSYPITFPFQVYNVGNISGDLPAMTAGVMGDIIEHGKNESECGLNGISPTPDANLYAGNSLASQYPAWLANAINVLNPDGSVSTFYPASLAVNDPEAYGNTGSQADAQSGIVPSTPYPAVSTLLDTLKAVLIGVTPSFPVNPTPVSISTPTPANPSGSSKAMWTVYNPTQAQIDSLGAWLWSNNFIDQLVKMFNSPSEAIISLHKMYVTPSTGNTTNIVVGYLNSGVSAPVINQQYETFDCGTVSLKEYYGNCEDYARYTAVQLYLPFIGFAKLNTNDVMGGSVNVTYHTDNYTGAFLAVVTVTKNSGAMALYQYGGNMGVHYPLSAGSFASVITSLLSTGAGIAGTIASGGALAPVAMGGAMSLLNARATVSVSGGFNSCTGAMGSKKPYIVITRPITNNAINYNNYYGYPNNTVINLSSCSGYTRVRHVFTHVNTATDAEKTEIETLLKEGVLL